MIYGQFDDSWKSAILQPLQKKSGSDLSNTNYRLVSNLKFISKLVAKCVLMQLEDHLTLNGLHADHQSAYDTYGIWNTEHDIVFLVGTMLSMIVSIPIV